MTLLTMRGTLMAPATDLCLGAPVVPQDYLSEGGSILFLVGEGGEGLHVRTLSDFCWGENQRFLREKKQHIKDLAPQWPMSMILGYFGFQVKVEYSGITFYNSIYYSPTTTPLSYCLCFIELGVLWLPGVPFLSGKSNTNVNYLLEECLQLQGFLLVALLAGSHWDGIELDSMILQDSPRLYCVLPSGKHTKTMESDHV